MKIFRRKLARCVLIAISTMAIAVPASAQVGQVEVQVTFETIQCIDEEDDLSNDEPYLIIVPFFVDGTTVRIGRVQGGRLAALPGSRVTVMKVARTQDNIVNGDNWCQEGRTYLVPASTGRFTHRMAPISPEVLGASGTLAATVGVVVAVVEEDSNSRFIADSARDALVSFIRSQLEFQVFQQQPDINGIVAQMRRGAEHAAFAATSGQFNLARMLGTDDLVGVRSLVANLVDLSSAGPAGVVIDMSFGPPNGEYHLIGRIVSRPVAPPLPPQMTVTVHRVLALGGFGETADFYAKIDVGGIQRRSATIDNRDEIFPNWSFTITPPPGDIVPVRIEIWESDDGSGDDPVDLSGAPGFPHRLSVNRRTGEISEDGRFVGRLGQRINTRGIGSSEKALMVYSIN